MGKLWLTRPAHDSAELAASLGAHGIAAHIAPVMHITPIALSITLSTLPDALLMSSRHAAHALAQLPPEARALPVFCVGGATAAAAQAAGFTHTIAGESDMLALLPRLTAQLRPGSKVLYLAGEETRVDAVTLLNAQQIKTEKMITYKADAETVLDSITCESIKNGTLNGVVFFSPRSAQIANELVRAHGLSEYAPNISAYCLSLAVAEAAGALPWRHLRTCHSPTQAAMVDLLVSHSPA